MCEKITVCNKIYDELDKAIKEKLKEIFEAKNETLEDCVHLSGLMGELAGLQMARNIVYNLKGE